MGIRYWFLMLLLGAEIAHAVPVKVKNYCLDCHPAHYAELGSCVSCHRGFAGTKRLNIAHEKLLTARFSAFTLPDHPIAKQGRKLLDDYACRRCHASSEKGNRLAANLDQSQWKKTAAELETAIQSPVLFMPVFHFSEDQRTALINGILLGGVHYLAPEQEQPEVIHFEGETVSREFQFEKHCGNCHRVLSGRYGGLGSGVIGPNLSGIFSEFYLPNFGQDNQRWTLENLEKWLKNPRKIKPFAQMPPVELKTEEFNRIYAELHHHEPGNTTLPEGSWQTATMPDQ